MKALMDASVEVVFVQFSSVYVSDEAIVKA